MHFYGITLLTGIAGVPDLNDRHRRFDWKDGRLDRLLRKIAGEPKNVRFIFSQ